MRFAITVLSLFFLIVSYAHASQKEDLKRIEADLSKQRAEEVIYKNQQASIQRKLEKARDELVKMTRDIQGHEKALLKIQDRREETQKEFTETQQKLNMRRDSLAQLIVALQRLSRLPPQALLARPSAPIDMARSFDLLQEVIPGVSSQAHDIKIILDDLVTLQDTLKHQEEEVATEHDALKEKHASLEKVLKERQALLKKTQANQQAAARKSAALASQARDLRALLDGLARQEKEDPAIRMKPLASIGSTLKSFWGGATLPVAGRIKTGFDQTMPGGGKSRGLSIQAASGAMVTAPHDGIVRFAGPFRQYKLLVIIQHANGEHSLLGGLQELYTRTGDRVSAGEPVGKLPDRKMEGDSSQSASLYYERRRNGKPIDPRSAKG